MNESVKIVAEPDSWSTSCGEPSAVALRISCAESPQQR
jgi:hypothetical protein